MHDAFHRCGILLALGALLLAAACGSARRGALVADERAITDPRVALGQRVFDQQCHACHPDGTGGLAPAINNKPLPGFMIRFQVRHGLGAMPSFSEEEISEEELDAVVAYLKWLRAGRPDRDRVRAD